MDMNAYQKQAIATAIYPENSKVTYTTLGLVGEAGEVAEKVKKLIRSGKSPSELSIDDRMEIAKELGDVLWYIANLAADLNFGLESVAGMNIVKLASRQSRGVIEGNGDNR